MTHRIKYKKINPMAIMPKKGSEGAIAFDLAIPEDVLVHPGRQTIPLGWAIELPIGYELKIEPRSGFSSKGMEGITCDNWYRGNRTTNRFDADVLPGKVDSDYRGEVGVIVNNHGSHDYTSGMFMLEAGTRIAQATIYHSDPDWYFEEVDELSETKRGEGGFGHTGSN